MKIEGGNGDGLEFSIECNVVVNGKPAALDMWTGEALSDVLMWMYEGQQHGRDGKALLYELQDTLWPEWDE